MAAFVAQIGVYNAFEAALQAGCQRVLFASSVHSMLGYPIDWGEGGKGEATDNKLVPNPVNTYGATKAWGEALCRKYSNADDLSCIAMRVRTTHSLPELPASAADPFPSILVAGSAVHLAARAHRGTDCGEHRAVRGRAGRREVRPGELGGARGRQHRHRRAARRAAAVAATNKQSPWPNGAPSYHTMQAGPTAAAEPKA